MKKSKKILLTIFIMIGFNVLFMTTKTFAINLEPRMSLSTDTKKVTCEVVDFNGIKEVTVNGKKKKVVAKELKGSNNKVVRGTFTISKEGDFEIKVSDGTKEKAKILTETITIKKDQETGVFSVNRAPRIKIAGSEANEGQEYSGDETITITDNSKLKSVRIYEYKKDANGKGKYVSTNTAASVIEYKMQYKKSEESKNNLIDVDNLTDASVVTIKFRPQSKEAKYKIKAIDQTGKTKTRVFSTVMTSVKDKEYNYNYVWDDTFIKEETYDYNIQYVPSISLNLKNEQKFIMKNSNAELSPLTKVTFSKQENGKWNTLATYTDNSINGQMKLGAGKLLKKGKSGTFRITATGANGSTIKKIIQLKRLNKVKDGKYFTLNNAPRLTYKISKKAKFSVTAKDNTGLKSIKIEAATEKSGNYDKTLLNITSEKLENKKEDTVKVDLSNINKINKNYELKVTATDSTGMKSVETFKIESLAR